MPHPIAHVPFIIFSISNILNNKFCHSASFAMNFTPVYNFFSLFFSYFSANRTLQELVEHYSKDSDGLCVNLCKPCVQVSGLILSIVEKNVVYNYRKCYNYSNKPMFVHFLFCKITTNK